MKTSINSETLNSLSLFHFMRKKEYLLSNLKDGFLIRSKYEVLPCYFKFAYIIPMLCFCDIPLGKIKNILPMYGNYGIGIKRKTAIINNITPLTYFHRGSKFVNQILKESINCCQEASPLIPYLKPIFKLQNTKDKKRKYYDFISEHEWRYIEGSPLLFFKDNANNSKRKISVLEKKQNAIFKFKMKKFTVQDIEYIIFPKADFEEFKEFFNKYFKEDYIEMLTKIITTEQLIRDF